MESSFLTQIFNDMRDLLSEHAMVIIERIGAKYGIPESELLDLWTATLDEEIIQPIKQEEKNTSRIVNPPKSNQSVHMGCIGIFTSGKRKGEICGAKVKDGLYCGRHARQAESMEQIQSNESKDDRELPEYYCKAILKLGVYKGLECGHQINQGETYCINHKYLENRKELTFIKG